MKKVVERADRPQPPRGEKLFVSEALRKAFEEMMEIQSRPSEPLPIIKEGPGYVIVGAKR